jgi:hypothetical protein
MVYIYSPSENSKRLHYIARHLFNHLLGTDFEITQDKRFFLQQTDVCINYSEEELPRGLQIIPQGLLTEKGIRSFSDLDESEWKGLFVFFKQAKGDIPFDLFAASFYLLTLYEEYIPARLDQHERFHHEESLAYRKGFLEIPIIDRWTYLLKEELEQKSFDTSAFRLRKYRVISTFDIDHPFLYRNKGWIKNIGGAIRDLLQGNLNATGQRAAVQLHLKQDPYFKAIHWIDEIQKQFKRPYYLFVLIAGKSPYDRKTVYPQRRFYNYLRQLQNVTIGLHPSYLTLRNLTRLMREKTKLEDILKRPVAHSRQHFLRMQNPETFQELNLAGLQEDFTLTFAHAPGFRSGTAVPYFFYDMEREEETGLLIRPTIMMDSTFIFHQKLKPEEALQKIKNLADACKQSGGDYLSLWHNSNLSGTEKENPWISVFIRGYQYALSIEVRNSDAPGKL